MQGFSLWQGPRHSVFNEVRRVIFPWLVFDDLVVLNWTVKTHGMNVLVVRCRDYTVSILFVVVWKYIAISKLKLEIFLVNFFFNAKLDFWFGGLNGLNELLTQTPRGFMFDTPGLWDCNIQPWVSTGDSRNDSPLNLVPLEVSSFSGLFHCATACALGI